MVGVLGILGLGMIAGSGFANTVRKDMSSQSSRNWAKEKGDIVYIDGYRNYRSTETNELVYVKGVQGADCGYRVVGQESGRVYANEQSKEDKEKARLKEAIQYCKDNNIKYLPWYFPTNSIRKHSPACTGIEIETGKKYLCNYLVHTREYTMIYLEDKPHNVHTEYGYHLEFDAVKDKTEQDNKAMYKALHDGDLKLFKELSCVKCQHRGENSNKSYWYYTKVYFIDKAEYDEKLTELEEYPIEFIKWHL